MFIFWRSFDEAWRRLLLVIKRLLFTLLLNLIDKSLLKWDFLLSGNRHLNKLKPGPVVKEIVSYREVVSQNPWMDICVFLNGPTQASFIIYFQSFQTNIITILQQM